MHSLGSWQCWTQNMTTHTHQLSTLCTTSWIHTCICVSPRHSLGSWQCSTRNATTRWGARMTCSWRAMRLKFAGSALLAAGEVWGGFVSLVGHVSPEWVMLHIWVIVKESSDLFAAGEAWGGCVSHIARVSLNESCLARTYESHQLYLLQVRICESCEDAMSHVANMNHRKGVISFTRCRWGVRRICESCRTCESWMSHVAYMSHRKEVIRFICCKWGVPRTCESCEDAMSHVAHMSHRKGVIRLTRCRWGAMRICESCRTYELNMSSALLAAVGS